MPKRLSAQTCETVKPSIRDRLLGDGDGLFLRVRPHGTKTWVIEYEHQGKRTKYTIGGYARDGAPGNSIPEWLRHGQQSLTQARSIAGAWKAARRGGHDPAAEWEALLEQERQAEAAKRAEVEAERKQPTVREAVDSFMQKIMAGKKSAPAIRYRLDRLAALIGDRKIRDVTRQDVIAALDTIAQGEREGKTAKQLAGEVLTQAKRLWRFAAEREWIADSPIEKLTRAAFDAKPNKRDVTLRLDELAAIWRALDNRELCKSDPSTISRELRRNRDLHGYRPKQAHELSRARAQARENGRRIDAETWAFAEAKLAESWSPEQISGYLKVNKQPGISHETLYRHIYADQRKARCKSTLHHQK